jgi:hypothetical protein
MSLFSLLFKQINIIGTTMVQKHTTLALNIIPHDITRAHTDISMVSKRQYQHTIWTPCFKQSKDCLA